MSTTLARTALATFLVAAALAASAAQAATYYISPTGSATNTGLTTASAWNVSAANARLVPGDVCYVLPGTYSTMIDPVNSGTPVARITIVGNLQNPAAATFNGTLDTDRSFLTFKGIKFTGTVAFTASNASYVARYDSVAHCIMRGAHFVGAKNSIVCKSRIINDATPTGMTVAFVLDHWAEVGPRAFASNAESDTLRGNEIDCGITSYKAFTMSGHAQRCVIDSNRVSVRWEGDPVDPPGGRSMFNSYYNTFRDNKWTMEANNGRANGWPWYFCGMRDSSSYNLFERDTIFAGLQSGILMQGWLQQSGYYPGAERGNQWRNCVYRVTGGMILQITGVRALFDHCEFASSTGPALEFSDRLRYLTLNHNTFYSPGNQAVLLNSVDTSTPGDSIRFTNNIFYAKNSSSTVGAVTFNSTGGFVSNNNLFWSPAYSQTPGDRSVGYGGTARTVPNWCSLSGKDCNSVGGDPRFVNTTSLSTLDLHLSSNSAARGIAQLGQDAGAYPFLTAGPDATAPAAVSGLAALTISDQVVVLGWAAPGDDGQTGTAAQYEIRMSQQPITAANFSSATPLANPPSPLAAGTAQSYVTQGLTPGQTYYFALRARDEAGNWSAISNVLMAATDASDRTAPSSVSDLRSNP